MKRGALLWEEKTVKIWEMRGISLQTLLEAGCHFGHQVRRWNPAMKPYIYGAKDGIHIFDLAKTKQGLEEAAAFVKATAAEGGVILLVGTKRQAAEVVKREAVRAGMPYMSQRWLGGLLTNWEQMAGRIRKLTDMKGKRAAGEYKKYTKKEQLLIDREIARLEKFLEGVEGMAKLPDALVVVDVREEEVAVKEAERLGIPVVGVVDSNSDPANVKYVIPCNDDARGAIELVVTTLAEAIISAKR